MNRARSAVSPAPSLILVMAATPALLGSMSCGRLTELVLVVDTDMDVPAELDLVDISIALPSGPIISPSPSVDLKLPGAPSFPMTLGLVQRGTASSVVVTVTGRHRDASLMVTDVAAAEAHAKFVDGETRTLPILLSAACLGVTCTNSDQICKLGRCVPLALPTWSGSVTRTDQRPTLIGSRSLWATGWRSCATKGQGLYCWGENTNGQVGSGTMGSPVPTRALAIGLPDEPLKTIGLGYEHSCVCTSSGQAWCWGLNDNGQVLPGGAMVQPTPVQVPGVTDCVQIAGGWYHTCAVTGGARVTCWGRNVEGQAGQPAAMMTTGPQVVAGLSAVVQVQAGERFTCAISTTNAVSCWGDNGRGQLGDGSTSRSFTPRKVAGLADRPVSLALGRNFACLQFSSGQVSCWGENSDNMTGTGPTATTMPTMIAGIDNATQIAAGHQHACVLRSTGVVSCWGSGQFGQLGNGNMTTSVLPVDVALADDVGPMTSLAIGDQHSCARNAAGAVYCWGQNVLGQLGDGGWLSSPNPVKAIGF